MSDWKNVQYKGREMRTSEGNRDNVSALTDLSAVYRRV